MDGRTIAKGRYDVAIVGAGVTGVALARELARRAPKARIVLVDKEPGVAAHASGRNSGVLHVGYNQKPGTLKARFCVEGNRRAKEYCREKGVPLAETGILVLALDEREAATLAELKRRGDENGAPGLRILSAEEVAAREPNAARGPALLAPSGAAVDAGAMVRALAEDAKAAGVELMLGAAVRGAGRDGDGFRLELDGGELRAARLVNCAGAHADRLAHGLGAGLDYAIVPFRGEYYVLDPAKAGLVRSMVYGVPDLRYPFLGVHWTRTPAGAVKVGPNAVLAPGREAYRTMQAQPGDMLAMALDPRFWRMLLQPEFRRLAAESWRTALDKDLFVKQALKLVRGASPADFRRGTSGIRAQVVDRFGKLVDDILVEEKDGALHVLNVVSPGFTCALPFAGHLADRLGF